jgi:hypothetical protein
MKGREYKIFKLKQSKGGNVIININFMQRQKYERTA